MKITLITFSQLKQLIIQDMFLERKALNKKYRQSENDKDDLNDLKNDFSRIKNEEDLMNYLDANGLEGADATDYLLRFFVKPARKVGS